MKFYTPEELIKKKRLKKKITILSCLVGTVLVSMMVTYLSYSVL